jgi:hypothetical protein
LALSSSSEEHPASVERTRPMTSIVRQALTQAQYGNP